MDRVTNDKQWEEILNIRTTGRDDSRSDDQHFPYEPTDYCVLERLSSYSYIRKKDVLLDYGCGKGRVSFFMAYQTGCHAIGIEYDERLVDRAKRNKKRAISGTRVEIIETNAIAFEVPLTVTRCYFFNPFSRDVFKKILYQLRLSYQESPREIILFFYYPSPEYELFFDSHPWLEVVETISCEDLFEESTDREKIVVCKVK